MGELIIFKEAKNKLEQRKAQANKPVPSGPSMLGRMAIENALSMPLPTLMNTLEALEGVQSLEFSTPEGALNAVATVVFGASLEDVSLYIREKRGE